MVGRLFFVWNAPFSGDMFNFRTVWMCWDVPLIFTNPKVIWNQRPSPQSRRNHVPARKLQVGRGLHNDCPGIRRVKGFTQRIHRRMMNAQHWSLTPSMQSMGVYMFDKLLFFLFLVHTYHHIQSFPNWEYNPHLSNRGCFSSWVSSQAKSPAVLAVPVRKCGASQAPMVWSHEERLKGCTV